MLRHLTKISDFSKAECEKIINKAIEIKAKPEKFSNFLKGETLLMLFEKPSLRTRISFETGMHQLGGHAIFYSIKDSPLGKKENISDTAKDKIFGILPNMLMFPLLTCLMILLIHVKFLEIFNLFKKKKEDLKILN